MLVLVLVLVRVRVRVRVRVVFVVRPCLVMYHALPARRPVVLLHAVCVCVCVCVWSRYKVYGNHALCHERLAIVDPSQSRHPPFSRTAFRRATLARDPQRVAPFCSCCPHTVLLASGANHTPCLRGRPFLSHQWLSATDPPVPVLVPGLILCRF